MKKIILLILCIFLLTGCSPTDTQKENSKIHTENTDLIYKETISPNEEYTDSKDEIVTYEVKIYQDKNNTISVITASNSEFFKPIEYQLEYDKEITKSDINIKWTTAMGSTNPSKEDQLCIATVSIAENDNIISERKISFINGGMDIIIDLLNSK